MFHTLGMMAAGFYAMMTISIKLTILVALTATFVYTENNWTFSPQMIGRKFKSVRQYPQDVLLT